MVNKKVINKWLKMLNKNSIFHVRQTVGKCYSKEEILGYYNDLTSKVSKDTLLDNYGIPYNVTASGMTVYFPITIFQYGLGLYDLFLLTNEKKYYDKFLIILNWAYDNMNQNGKWECMSTIGDNMHESQSSMCQSEGVSILLRGYVKTKKKKYYSAATKAINYMISPIEKGGTCYYKTKDMPIFQEYVSKYNLSVLNGWIFSIFGLYDYTLINQEKKYSTILKNTVNSLAIELHKYDRKIWSNYDQRKTIASPAYNDLHVEQLRLMWDLFGKDEFMKYAKKWEKNQKSKLKTMIAMIIKLKQKLFKSKYYDINSNLVK